MGWTCTTNVMHYKDGTVDRQAECDAMYNCDNEDREYKVLKSVMHGTTYYAVVSIFDKKKYCKIVRPLVILTQVENDNWSCNFYYKDIYSPELPKKLLDLLPNDMYNIKYKRECIEEKWKEKEKKNQFIPLSKVKIGQKITFKVNDKTYVVRKMERNYQFKTTWFYNESNNTYYPKRYIPKEFQIVE